MATQRTPQYGNHRPASLKASLTGTGNKRSGTRPEELLIRALRKLGIRARPSRRRVLGNPDIVFWKQRLVVFCDGDFWHGRKWSQRRVKLLAGWNADYWIPKIEYNRRRDRHNTRLLKNAGWKVIRLWELDVLKNPVASATKVLKAIKRDYKCDGRW